MIRKFQGVLLKP